MTKALVGNKPYVIPPRPEAFIKLSRLLAAPEPDIDEIITVLKQDPSLYAAVLSMANSSLFSAGGKTSSLKQAVMRLGLEKLHTIVRVVALKNSLSKAGPIERFWDTATEVAELTARLAFLLTNENPDEAYSLGMMHDCGIPLMMEAFPDYRDFLININSSNLSKLHILEAQLYGVDHFNIGSEIASGWQMPETICDAIRWQPDFINVLQDKTKGSESSKMLLCCLLLAKDISATYRHFWRVDSAQPVNIELKTILEYLGIPEMDYQDIRDDQLEALEKIR